MTEQPLTVVKRTYWKRAIVISYEGESFNKYHQVDAPSANLVASLTECGLHAPTFDLDLSAERSSRHRRELVTIGAKGMRIAVERFLTTMHRLGIVHLSPFDLELPFVPAGVEVPLPPLDMAVPHRLLPSSTPGHFHLYIDVELPWDAYADLLRAACAAGVINENYLNHALERQMSYLIKPGLTKADLPEFYRVDGGEHVSPEPPSQPNPDMLRYVSRDGSLS